MARQLKVFVSYSRHESEVDRVSAICDWLSELSNDQVSFVLDKSLRAGDNVYDFEKSASSYPAVLVIGTRRYRDKVASGDYGVAREHDVIMRAHQLNQLSVFTVITESDHNAVFPEDMKGILATNLAGILYDPDYRQISNASRASYKPQANALVTDILASKPTRTYSRANVSNIRQKLFFEQKQEAISADLDDQLLQRVFVKTSYFNAVINKSSYLLIGRKGSGKSFLTDYFTRFPLDDNAITILIHFKDFKLSSIYLMGSTSRIAPDVGKLIAQEDLFECAWNLVFATASILQIYIEIKEHRLDYDFHKISKLEDFVEVCGCIDLDFRTGRRSVSVQRLMDWSTEQVFHIAAAGIESLDGEYAKAVSKIQSLTDPSAVLPAVLGLGLLGQFSEVCGATQPAFLLAIDGFDSKFDNFRRETNSAAHHSEDRSSRVRFEVSWLKGLLEATQTIINPPPGRRLLPSSALYRLLVTLPGDRFIEVQASDRDAFRYRHKHVEIRWSGPELMNLIRKRLEVYYDKNCISATIDQKLNEAMAWTSDINQTIKFVYNHKQISIDVFSYFLRHSFWRPRDLLYHVSLLIEMGYQYSKIGRSITVDKVREIARRASVDIINQEFIGEFESIFPKIKEFISLFYEQPIEMSYGRLFSIVQSADIRLSSGEYIEESANKIDFLYEIGFLGVVVDESRRAKLGFRRREAFSFSESVDDYKLISLQIKQASRWVVHPIFSEFLQLQTKDAPFLLNYDRNYLTASD